jgi:hypothetical protein
VKRASTLPLVLTLVAAVGFGCARARIQLPSGPSVPLDHPQPVLDAALAPCHDLESLTLEAGLSGHAGGRRLRARLLAGLAKPSSIRLEAVAPFGPPGFILAASGPSSVLLLPRDDRVLRDAPPAQILAAMAGIEVTPADLLSYFAGCPGSQPRPGSARRFGETWVAIDLDDDGVAYLRRDSSWHLTAVVREGLRVVIEEWDGTHPVRVRMQSVPPEGPSAFDLVLRLSQVERNVALPDAAFTVDVPPEADPITLDELREAGPMREAARAERTS